MFRTNIACVTHKGNTKTCKYEKFTIKFQVFLDMRPTIKCNFSKRFDFDTCMVSWFEFINSDDFYIDDFDVNNVPNELYYNNANFLSEQFL